MSFFSDLQVLYHLLLKPTRGKSHAERMENFYGGQAAAYDSFRKKLLKGRQELYSQIEVPEGGVWVEMGGGTGSNLEYLGDKIHALSEIYIVDVSPSLLQMAQRRVAGVMLKQLWRMRRHGRQALRWMWWFFRIRSP